MSSKYGDDFVKMREAGHFGAYGISIIPSSARPVRSICTIKTNQQLKHNGITSKKHILHSRHIETQLIPIYKVIHSPNLCMLKHKIMDLKFYMHD